MPRKNINIESGLYVAADGNYGDAASMLIVDDSNWVPNDYDILDLTGDSTRADLAEALVLWIREGRPELDYDYERESIDEVILLKYRGY